MLLPLCYLRMASKSINICKNIIYGKMIPLSVKPGGGVKVFLAVYQSLVSTSFSRLCFVISFGTFICNFIMMPYGYSSTFLNINRQSISEISFKMWLFFTIGLVHVSIGPPINGGEKKHTGLLLYQSIPSYVYTAICNHRVRLSLLFINKCFKLLILENFRIMIGIVLCY